MYAKNLILLAAAGLIAESVAVNVHRHGHAQVHKNMKKDLKLETEYETVTEWVTVTYDPSLPTTTANANKFVEASHSKDHTRTRKYSKAAGSSSSSSSTVEAEPTSSPSSVAAVSAPSTPVDVPTTLIPQVKPTEEVKAPTSIDTPAPAPTTQAPQAPAPPTTEAAQPAPTTASGNPASAPPSGAKLGRGLAYNDPKLVPGFLGQNSKCGWKYNWGQTNDGDDNIPFIPMLWSPRADHLSTWQANADKAIAAGSPYFLSFNECDNAGQCNMSPADAAAAHKQHMNPYGGKVKIVAPAITNSNIAGEGPDWLKAWVEACNGECVYDACAMHWYDNDLSRFLPAVKAVHDICKKPVWITEFAPVGSLSADELIGTVIKELETNPDYSFVEAFSYFMVGEGPNMLTSNGQPNGLGNKFAYGS